MPTENEQRVLNISREAGELNRIIRMYRDVQRASEEAERNCVTDPVAAARIKTGAPGHIRYLGSLIEAFREKYRALIPGIKDTIARFYSAAGSASMYVRIPKVKAQVKRSADELYAAIA